MSTDATVFRAVLVTLAGLGDDECWTWPGVHNNQGYGVVCGRLAHRVLYEMLYRPIPDGLTLDHLCRNRACCNPRHLEPVTQQENVLRGMGFAATNAAKTHCVNGHELNELNTYTSARNQRKCRLCHREASRARRDAGRVPPTHGLAGYTNYKCRCDICSAAMHQSYLDRRPQ